MRLGTLSFLFPSGATDVFSMKLLKGVLPNAELLVWSKALNRGPRGFVGSDSPGYLLLNFIELAMRPCTSPLAIGDV
jgi:hypothetical protein